MRDFEKLLSGGDLRSIGNCDLVISKVKNQKDFDELIKFIFHKDRIIVMRTADAIEKISVKNPGYLSEHKKKFINLLVSAKNIELKWHLALMMPRLKLTNKEFDKVWSVLIQWANDKTNSKLVRVGAIQGLFEMTKEKNNGDKDFIKLISVLEKENVPSIKARIKNIRKEFQMK